MTACAIAVLISLGFGTAHANALDLVGEIQTPDGLKHSVYANYASRSAFASVTAPSDSTEQVRFAAFGQDLTLARDYTNAEDGLLAWHGTDGSGAVAQEWRGKQVSYRVFEWVGNQKLYSDEVSLVLR